MREARFPRLRFNQQMRLRVLGERSVSGRRHCVARGAIEAPLPMLVLQGAALVRTWRAGTLRLLLSALDR